MATAWPLWFNKSNTNAVLHACMTEPVLRPTSLKIAPPSCINNPSWVYYGFSLPLPPADGTLTAPPIQWSWEYDPYRAEISAFTDGMGVRTEVTYQNESLFNGDVKARAVVKTVSHDPKTGKSFSRSWKRGTSADGSPNVVLRESFGKLEAMPRVTELVYVSRTENTYHYGNGICQRVVIKENDREVSKVTHRLGTEGRSHCLSRVIFTETVKDGQPTVKEEQFPEDYGRQTPLITTSVNGVQVQRIRNHYDDRKEKLFPSVLTLSKTVRVNPATGADFLESNLHRWFYNWERLMTLDYREGMLENKGSAKEGFSYVYDNEGRVVSTNPLGADDYWKKAHLWKLYDWVIGRTTTLYEDKNTQSSEERTFFESAEHCDSVGRPLRMLDARGLTTTMTYDVYGRPCSVQPQGLGAVSNTYSPDHRTNTVSKQVAQDAAGAPVTVTTSELQDGFGHVMKRTFADGTSQEYEYDDYGRLAKSWMISASGVRQSPAITTYDALDRLTTVTSPSGASYTLAYSVDGPNRVTTKTQEISDGKNVQIIKSQVFTNVLGQVVKTISADGTVSTNTYDGQGNLASSTLQPLEGPAQVRSYRYDYLGRLVESNEPETGVVRYEGHTPFGKPTRIIEASGRKRHLEYDGLSRLRKVTSDDGKDSKAFVYSKQDLVSQMAVVNGMTVTQSFEYQGPAKQLSCITLQQPGCHTQVSYRFDPYGALQALTYPSGRVVKQHYDSVGRINGLSLNDKAVVSGMVYDMWGHQNRITFASSAYSQWDYKDLGTHLDKWTIGGGRRSFVPQVRQYAYDTGDRLMLAGEWALSHNVMNQLTTAAFKPQERRGQPFVTQHTYDGYGNQTSHLEAGNGAKDLINFDLNPMVDNKVPGLSKNQATTGWSYNANGEATNVGMAVATSEVLALTWDGLGHLSAVQAPGATQAYAYDANGLRSFLKDSVDPSRNRYFLYGVGNVLLGEYGTERGQKRGVTREVLYLGGHAVAEVDEKGVHELHSDHLGSPRVITGGATGNIEGAQAFGAYGESLSGEGMEGGYRPLTGYTGHMQMDATGLIYMKGRYYSPAWHRFVNSDHGLDPNCANEYAYCCGNPFGMTDPTGMYSRAEFKSDCSRTWDRVKDWCGGVRDWFRDRFSSDGVRETAMRSAEATKNAYSRDYQVKSATTVEKAGKGDIKGAFKELGGAWKSALHDSEWRRDAIISTVGATLTPRTGRILTTSERATVEFARPDNFSRQPKGLMDKMVLDAAKSGAGEKLKIELKDPRFTGMEKWSYSEKSDAGLHSEVHYVRDPATGQLMDFKFKHHGREY